MAGLELRSNPPNVDGYPGGGGVYTYRTLPSFVCG